MIYGEQTLRAPPGLNIMIVLSPREDVRMAQPQLRFNLPGSSVRADPPDSWIVLASSLWHYRAGARSFSGRHAAPLLL